MICVQCRSRNPIGNKFCRECGTKLGEPEPGSLEAEERSHAEAERSAERAAELLTEAFRLSESDRVDLALPLAEEAATLLPESTSALTLLASLYERAEQIGRAVETMERVVALNPDSEADKTKLDQLQRGVHVLPRRTVRRRIPELPRWSPAVAAGAVAAVVLGIGVALVNGGSAHSQTEERIPVGPPPPGGASATSAPGTGRAPGTVGAPGAPAGSARTNPFAGPPPSTRPDPFAPIPGSGASSRASGGSYGGRSASPTYMPPLPGSGSLADVPQPRKFRSPGGARPTTGSSGYSGVSPLPPLGQNGGVPSPAYPAPGDTPDRIVVGPPTAPIPQNNDDGNSRRNDGYIRIHVRPPGSRPAAPAQAAPAPAPPEKDPFDAGNEYMRAGRYNEAIASFQKALPNLSGYSRGMAYQMMAMSYRNLGRTSDARDAYQQAIAAYQLQLATGRSTGPAQRGLQACRDALAELKGA